MNRFLSQLVGTVRDKGYFYTNTEARMYQNTIFFRIKLAEFLIAVFIILAATCTVNQSSKASSWYQMDMLMQNLTGVRAGLATDIASMQSYEEQEETLYLQLMECESIMSQTRNQNQDLWGHVRQAEEVFAPIKRDVNLTAEKIESLLQSSQVIEPTIQETLVNAQNQMQDLQLTVQTLSDQLTELRNVLSDNRKQLTEASETIADTPHTLTKLSQQLRSQRKEAEQVDRILADVQLRFAKVTVLELGTVRYSMEWAEQKVENAVEIQEKAEQYLTDCTDVLQNANADIVAYTSILAGIDMQYEERLSWITGFFGQMSDAYQASTEITELVQHIEEQAELRADSD